MFVAEMWVDECERRVRVANMETLGEKAAKTVRKHVEGKGRPFQRWGTSPTALHIHRAAI